MRARLPFWTIARRSTATAFLILLVLGGRGQWEWFEGSALATRFASWLRFVDPLAAMESAIARHEFPVAMMQATGILVLAAIILGPIFCAWACPLGLILDLNDSLRRRFDHWRHRRTFVLPQQKPRKRWRLVVLGFTLGFAATSSLLLFTPLSPIQMVVSFFVTGSVFSVVVVVALMVIEWFAPRLWCRSLCPLGALYSLLGRFAILKIRIDRTRAGLSPCRLCSIHCPMGIRVMEDHSLKGATQIDDPACTRCGGCLDVCNNDVLSYCPHRVEEDSTQKEATLASMEA